MILLTYSRGQIIDRKDFLKIFSCSFPFLYRQGFVNHHHIILIYKGSNVVQSSDPISSKEIYVFDDDQKTIHAQTNI